MSNPDLQPRDGESYRSFCFRHKSKECVICEKTPDEALIDVHHRDGDRENNTLSNLIPVCRHHHARIHHGESAPELKPYVEDLPPSSITNETSERSVSVNRPSHSEWLEKIQNGDPAIARHIETTLWGAGDREPVSVEAIAVGLGFDAEDATWLRPALDVYCETDSTGFEWADDGRQALVLTDDLPPQRTI